MRIALTGASGLLGANLVSELLAAGHQVRATRRASTRVDHLADLAIEWVDGDLDVPASLEAAFAGCQAVMHCAAQVGVTRAVTPALERANVDGTRHVLAAVRAVGARLVHCSSTVAVGLSEDGRPCDETAVWNFDRHGLADGYSITKRRAEDLVMAAARTEDRGAGGVDAVVVNPGYMLGPRDARPSSGKLIVDVVRGKVPGTTPGFNNIVDVRDVARGMRLALDKGRRGERYILGGDNVSYADLMRRIAAVAGVAAPRWSAPRPAVAVLGVFGDLYERFTGRDPLVNSITAGYAFSTAFQFTSAKAERELGYTHGPLEPAIRDAVAWFRQRGMI